MFVKQTISTFTCTYHKKNIIMVKKSNMFISVRVYKKKHWYTACCLAGIPVCLLNINKNTYRDSIFGMSAAITGTRNMSICIVIPTIPESKANKTTRNRGGRGAIASYGINAVYQYTQTFIVEKDVHKILSLLQVKRRSSP